MLLKMMRDSHVKKINAVENETLTLMLARLANYIFHQRGERSLCFKPIFKETVLYPSEHLNKV